MQEDVQFVSMIFFLLLLSLIFKGITLNRHFPQEINSTTYKYFIHTKFSIKFYSVIVIFLLATAASIVFGNQKYIILGSVVAPFFVLFYIGIFLLERYWLKAYEVKLKALPDSKLQELEDAFYQNSSRPQINNALASFIFIVAFIVFSIFYSILFGQF